MLSIRVLFESFRFQELYITIRFNIEAQCTGVSEEWLEFAHVIETDKLAAGRERQLAGLLLHLVRAVNKLVADLHY